jgi:hypothetical protein
MEPIVTPLSEKRIQQIILISFLISGLGLAFELAALVSLPQWLMDGPFRILSYLGYFIHLHFFRFDEIQFYNDETRLMGNYLNVAFYVIMITGSVLYWRSKQQETRLLRFSFAMIGGSSLFGILATITSIISYFEYYLKSEDPFLWVGIGVFTLRRIGIAILAYWVLKQLDQSRSLSFYRNAANEEILHDTPRGQRFFHHVMDNILCLLFFSGIIAMAESTFLNKVGNEIGEKTLIALAMVLCRMIYYMVFESLLSSTPAKYLTESRIVNFNGTSIKSPEAITRTACRFVPFEPLSFFGASGWHDLWSKTAVVKEVRTGVSGGWYFLFFPIVIVLGLGGYFGNEAYKDHQQYVKEKRNHDSRMQGFENEIKHLGNSHFIRLEDLNEPYSDDKVYLKIDSVYGDEAKVSVFMVSEYNDAPLYIADYYRSHIDVVNKQKIKISTLLSALPMDYDAYDKRENRGAAVLENTLYTIKEVFEEGQPMIEEAYGGGLGRDYISVSFNNCGWAAQVTKVHVLKGDYTWTNELPFAIEAGGVENYNKCANFSFNGTAEERGDYRFEFTVLDAKGKETVYVVDGSGLKYTLERKLGK